jgi:hypothetical protein
MLSSYPTFLSWKNKSMLMRSFCCLCLCLFICLCVSVFPPHQYLKAWTKLYETWYVYHGTWAHLKGVLHKSLPWISVSLCVSSHIVARQRLGKTFLWQQIRAAIIELLHLSFSVQFVWYQRRIYWSIYCSLVIQTLSRGNEELLKAPFSVLSVSYQRKVGE